MTVAADALARWRDERAPAWEALGRMLLEYQPKKETTIMRQKFDAVNELDDEGRPAGGYAQGVGFRIDWQKGPLREQETDAHEPAEPNGAFVETILAVVQQRIEHYQSGQFACRENALAITKIEEALHWLNSRTERRTREGVEGTHAGN